MGSVSNTTLLTVAPPLVVEFTDKPSFLAALPSPTAVGFDSLPANGTLAGNEFAGSGLTITQLDGNEINVVSMPSPSPSCVGYVNTPSNAISSSYATVAKPGYISGNCGLYFNNANSDNIRFAFTSPANAAGIYFAENDVAGVRVQFRDTSGNVMYSRFFSPNSPWSGFFGIKSSEPIGSMEVLNAANDNDGLTFDDVIFQPAP